MNNNDEGTSKQMTYIKSNAVGICALVFSILSFVIIPVLYVPIAIVLAIIALVKKQHVWGISAIVISIIVIFTSPAFWLLSVMLGLQ